MSTGQATPWDALLKALPMRLRIEPDQGASEARPGTKLSGLLAELASRDSASTLTLAVCSDLTPRQVWGLLKAPRAIGQVRFDAGRWTLAREFAGRDVERAAALLRDRGWRVQAPVNVRAKP